MQDSSIQKESRSVGTGPGHLSYVSGLDGLRAFAVIAVLLYHAGLAWIPGGFLGVEVFFVISGYLITALLLGEWKASGRIDLMRFWFRRARRLLPALFLVMFATVAYTVLFLPEEVAGLRADVLAALGYVTNWYLVVANESYFEAVGRPSLLQHLWSLAVEEQFYLLWPPLLAAGLMLLKFRRTLLATVALAALSALLMAVLYQPGVDPSRIYYGTDTRAAGLLLGAALAFFWVPGNFRRRPARGAGGLLDVVGLLALGGLVALALTLGEFQSGLYQGGFALVALCTVVLIAVVVHPGAWLSAALLGSRPLRWVGVRSYGIYLWHWPVFMVTRPQLDVPLAGLPLILLQLAATVLLADLSYRFVETPIRRGALERAWRGLRSAHGPRRRRLGTLWGGGIVASAALCILLGGALWRAEAPSPPEYLSQDAIHAEDPLSPDPPDSGAAAGRDPESAEGAPEEPAERPPNGPTTAIGDSVMLGASQTLESSVSGLNVLNAETGMQAEDAIAHLRERRAAGELSESVVLHVGNNGPVEEEQLDEMLALLEDVPNVVLVNVKVPRAWEQPNNELLATAAEERENVELADWYAATSQRPEYFWDDGIHLRPEGQELYAELLADEIGLEYVARAASPEEPGPE